MKYRVNKNKVLVVLQTGDEILESLYKIAEKINIKSCWINGIGAAKNIILGAYPLTTKEYIKKDFIGEYELTGLIGNITKKQNEPFVHIHATISDDDCNAFGGHLFSATVTATCEIMLTLMDTSIKRVECNEVGLYLWDFE